MVAENDGVVVALSMGCEDGAADTETFFDCCIKVRDGCVDDLLDSRVALLGLCCCEGGAEGSTESGLGGLGVCEKLDEPRDGCARCVMAAYDEAEDLDLSAGRSSRA